jgi:hypothetical protein
LPGQVKDVPAYLNIAIENDYGGAWELENLKKVEAKKTARQARTREKDKRGANKPSKKSNVSTGF